MSDGDKPARRRRPPLIDARPWEQLEQLYEELNPSSRSSDDAGVIELTEIAPGVYGRPRRSAAQRNPGAPRRRPRPSDVIRDINSFGEQLEQQLGEAFRKAFR